MSPGLANRLSSFQIAVCMSFAMSGSMLALNQGIGPDFLGHWMHAWMIGFLVGFPTSLLVVPVSRRWVDRVTNRAAAAQPVTEGPAAP